MRRFIPLAVCLIVVVPIGFVILFSAFSRHALNRFLEEIVARGEPIDPVELLGPEIPAEDNFFEAPIIVHLRSDAPPNSEGEQWESEEKIEWSEISGIQSSNVPEKMVPRYFGSFSQTHLFGGLSSEECLEEIRKYTKGREHTLRAVETASMRPAARKSYQITQGFDIATPELMQLLNIMRLLQLRSSLALESDMASAAAKDLQTNLRISRHLTDHPPLIFHLLAKSMLDISVGDLNAGLRQFKWSKQDLHIILEELSSLEVERSFLRSIRFERAINIQLAIESEHELFPSYHKWEILSDRLHDINCLKYFETIQKGLLVDEDGNLAFKAVPPPEQFAEALAELRSSKAKRILFFQAIDFLPTFEGFPKGAKRTSVALQQAQIAIFLELYRQKYSEFPRRLNELEDELDPDLLLDPFTDREMNYKRLPDGTYELYSVGLNGRDDGGLLKSNFEEGDWVWRLTLPDDFDYADYE